MMLNNPTPVIYQRVKMAMNEMPDNQPMEDKGGLLGPRKQMTNSQDDDIMSPAKRVVEYVKEIQKQREEIKNATNA